MPFNLLMELTKTFINIDTKKLQIETGAMSLALASLFSKDAMKKLSEFLNGE